MFRRIVGAACSAALIASLTATVAMAGEVTGNGTSKQIDGGKWGTNLHARSVCAFSGQEDLQYFNNEEGNTDPKAEPTKGDPSHAQSWGQIPKAVRDNPDIFGGLNPGTFCNPIKGAGEG
jgi:hypothetical protein